MEKEKTRKVIGRLGLALALLLLCLATAYADPPGTERVSVDSNGVEGNNWSEDPSISADGRYVAFQSGATNLDLVTVDNNTVSDVFVHDRQTGQTTRVSVDSAGNQATGGLLGSLNPSISADGRYVAFRSDATNLDLVTGDTNGLSDVFVHDRDFDGDGVFDEPGQVSTTRVSVRSDGNQATGGDSYGPSISADGRYVAFWSSATNLDLVTVDDNTVSDVFVHDRQTGQTTRVSVDSNGNQATGGGSSGPSISADGRYVAFGSAAIDLVLNDTNGQDDVFVHDRQTGQTTRVSVDSNGNQATGDDSWGPSISADGRHVAFGSEVINLDLVISDTNGAPDIFVHDRQTGQTTRVSVDSNGNQATGNSYDPSISADGRYVAFDSDADDLVTNDNNTAGDIFVRDRQMGQTTRVSVDSAGTEGDDFSSWPSISADGRYVAFHSDAINLVTGDENLVTDIFVRSRGDPALAITKQAAPDPAWAGEPLVYTLTISETGGLFNATGMVVSDTVPVSTTCCLNISNGGSQVGGDVLWAGLTVSSSQSISVTFVVTVNQVPSGTVVHNDYYGAVISTTKGVTGTTGSAVTTTVWVRPPVYLPLIWK